jgi:signal transduction histidine kinase
MVSGLCHDFNNHIMVILANAEMLEASTLPAAQGKLVDTIQRAGVRSRDLVRQLMGFARKNQETHRIRQDLRDLVEEGGALLNHLLRPQVRLEVIPGEGTCPVSVDPGQIIQVIMNLGINAQDAILGDGIIRLRTGPERLGGAEAEAQGREPGSYAFLEVEDSGSGIPEQIRSSIFDPFFTTKAPGKGTGLGLAMVHAIAKGHDGVLQCDSVLGRGTRIRILLPMAPPEAP